MHPRDEELRHELRHIHEAVDRSFQRLGRKLDAALKLFATDEQLADLTKQLALSEQSLATAVEAATPPTPPPEGK